MQLYSNASAPTAQTITLPTAPKTASPVPHLTSIHSTQARGHWGRSNYPGNCSGHLIRDLIQFYKPRNVFDPMAGSGTCKDVCKELGVPCAAGDIHQGFDACDGSHYPQQKFDFVWVHPPYWRMKKYSDDPRDLANAKTGQDFYLCLRKLITACKGILSENGKLAILMGDYHDVQLRRMIPCVHMTKEAALHEGLWPACTDIIRLQHGNSSSGKTCRTSFIPGLHDVCMVFEKQKQI